MRIGPWWIPLYTLRVTLGAALGVLWLWWAAPRRGFSRARAAGLLWSVAAMALLAARLGYALGQPAYFRAHPADLWRLTAVGGVHGASAWLGGLLAAWIWARWADRAPTEVWNLLAPASLLVAAGAWWACLDRGCAWGRVALSSPPGWRWAVAELPDLYHVVMPRYAVQTLGAAGALLLLPLALGERRCAGLAVALYLVGAAALTHLRADPVPQLGPYRADLLLNVALALGLWGTYWRAWRARMKEE